MLTRIFLPRAAAGLLFLLAFAPARFAGATTYTVTDLGVFSNDGNNTYHSLPNNISNGGLIVAGNMVGTSYQAWLYTAGGWTNLGTLGGNAQAEGLNEAGWVVGQSSTATVGGADHAFLWIPGSTNGITGNPQMQDLDPNGTDSEAGDVNNKGVITGDIFDSVAQNYTAFSFTYTNGVMITLSNAINRAAQNLNFGGSAFISLSGDSYGHAINDAGHIVGWAYDSSINGNQAYLWTNSPARSNGTAFFLGDLNGGYSGSEAFGINNSDQITGDAVTASVDTHAFRFIFASNTMIDLGTLASGDDSHGNAINNSNVIVGLSNLGPGGTPGGSVDHAFIAVSNTLVDLNTLLDSTGTNWVLGEANFINDGGAIVGTGTKLSDGLTHGFLLTPVLPAVFTPKIIAFTVSKTNVVLKFTTTNAATYYLDSRTNLVLGGWSNLLSGIAGTGGTNTVTNTANTAGTRFFRIRQTIP